jgi:DNA helicase-2/ATP-dependent DNA helicase PcrA
MRVPVLDGEGIALEPITSVERVEGSFVDLDVDDASNFFASKILVSNSIYEFRGATPEVFVGMSNLVPGGEGFKTKVLEMNYRSGKDIVDAANRLIAHNLKQIPMVCKADVDRKGLGAIQWSRVPTHEQGAATAADEIEDLVTGDDAQFNPGDFGIAVRTNAEAHAFGVELLKRGVPFRSKMNFFNDPTTKALTNWLKLARSGPDDTNVVNQVVLTAHRSPKFFLDKIFTERLQRLARGRNYLTWLEDGGWRQIYRGKEQDWRNRKDVLTYVKALRKIADLHGSDVSPKDMLKEIAALEGSERGGKRLSTIDSLIYRLERDADAMDILAEESPTGEVTDEAVMEAALAPIQPLIGLLEAYEDIGPAMDFVDKLQRANEKKGKKDDPDAADYAEPAVVIDTVHGWKGLQTKRMYVNMPRGVFPHALSEEGEEMDSERRLGYVALTRGMDSVTVLAPDRNHLGREAGPSPFIQQACIRNASGLIEEAEEQAQEATETAAKTASLGLSEEELDAFLADDSEEFEGEHVPGGSP